ncbi:hypothetical protein M9H77_28142 [Catharanthus roseus]|uniref:Uncharacterized protein n=1 Tax=Catharanthus roseus TaxID=4058 RepID=A0ACC0AEW1_CATRO|nr:hypothetical protein M9H77_28142 [Catharanthus roseus]
MPRPATWAAVGDSLFNALASSGLPVTFVTAEADSESAISDLVSLTHGTSTRHCRCLATAHLLGDRSSALLRSSLLVRFPPTVSTSAVSSNLAHRCRQPVIILSNMRELLSSSDLATVPFTVSEIRLAAGFFFPYLLFL